MFSGSNNDSLSRKCASFGKSEYAIVATYFDNNYVIFQASSSILENQAQKMSQW